MVGYITARGHFQVKPKQASAIANATKGRGVKMYTVEISYKVPRYSKSPDSSVPIATGDSHVWWDLSRSFWLTLLHALGTHFL